MSNIMMTKTRPKLLRSSIIEELEKGIEKLEGIQPLVNKATTMPKVLRFKSFDPLNLPLTNSPVNRPGNRNKH